MITIMLVTIMDMATGMITVTTTVTTTVTDTITVMTMEKKNRLGGDVVGKRKKFMKNPMYIMTMKITLTKREKNAVMTMHQSPRHQSLNTCTQTVRNVLATMHQSPRHPNLNTYMETVKNVLVTMHQKTTKSISTTTITIINMSSIPTLKKKQNMIQTEN
jgi:hypothetical protein